jgi:hypothetical protein
MPFMLSWTNDVNELCPGRQSLAVRIVPAKPLFDLARDFLERCASEPELLCLP